MKHNRDAFTMIELIFVIVVITILSTFAIPMLFGNKVSAQVSVCKQEVNQLIREMSTFYTLKGTSKTQLQEITNINSSLSNNGASPGDGTHGILQPSSATPLTTPITYACDGESAVAIKYETNQIIGSKNGYTTLTVTSTVPQESVGKHLTQELDKDGFFKKYIIGEN